MSFLTENIFRQMARMPRVMPRVIAIQAPRRFTTYTALNKTATETVKDAAKTVDRKVSDKLVDGINAAAAVGSKVKEGAHEVASGGTSGKAAELRGEAKGKASELKGEAKGAAEQAKGKVKGAADEVKAKL
ncbi:Fc.00g016620.m01.CDS01 [Cosmosporella sp. VM-42]